MQNHFGSPTKIPFDLVLKFNGCLRMNECMHGVCPIPPNPAIAISLSLNTELIFLPKKGSFLSETMSLKVLQQIHTSCSFLLFSERKCAVARSLFRGFPEKSDEHLLWEASGL